MAKIGLIAEESASLPQEVLREKGIPEVKLSFEWPEEKEIEGENTFKKLRKAKTLPKTAVRLGDTVKAIREGFQNFDELVIVVVSSKLSAYYSIAESLKKTTFADKADKLLVINSLNVVSGEGMLVLRVKELIDEGKSLKEIEKDANRLIPKIKNFFVMGDIRWMARRGRMPLLLNNTLYYLQKLGFIKFLVTVKEGKFKPVPQFFSRSTPKAIFRAIKKEAEGKKIRVGITHIDNEKEAIELKRMIEKKLPLAKIEYISPSNNICASFLAPGAISAAFYEEDY